MARTSVVGRINMNAIIDASTLHIGDLGEFRPVTYVLAVQREVPTFWDHEGDFAAYGLFSETPPRPDVSRENVRMTVRNANPNIAVDCVRVVSAASSALVQIGAVGRIAAEARVMHIRHFIRDR